MKIKQNEIHKQNEFYNSQRRAHTNLNKRSEKSNNKTYINGV